MKLPSLLSFAKKKGTPHEHLFALLITEEYIGAALWSLDNGIVDIIGRSKVLYQGDWSQIIHAADQALEAAAQDINQDLEVERVIFGLPPEYVEENSIKPDYLDGLKRLSRELSLRPSGFVVIPEALAYFLNKKEGTPVTAIFVGIEKSHIIVSLYKVGKLAGSMTVPRTEKIASDCESAIKQFKDIEVLPSRILLYDGDKSLQTIRDELLRYPWQTQLSFLHFPKIDSLPSELPLEAVAVAGASELDYGKGFTTVIDEETKQTQDLTAISNQPQSTEEENIPQPTPSLDQSSQIEPDDEKEELVNPSAMGFSSDSDTANTEQTQHEAPRPRMEVVVEEETKETPPLHNPLPLPSLPSFPKPKIHFPKFPINVPLVIIVGIFAIFLFGAVAVSAYWTIPAATVNILVDPKTIIRQMTVTFATNGSNLTQEGQIPGRIVETSVNGTKTIATTGKKKTGDPARGEITIYNKTTTEKIFSKATTLIGPKSLNFTLDDSVSVASISDVIVGTPGKATVKITATTIGTDSNLPAGSDFSFKDFPLTSYAARNEKGLTGGLSHDVPAVSKADYDTVSSSLTTELLDKAKLQRSEGIQNGEQLLQEDADAALSKKTFDHTIGEEANEVTLTGTLVLKGIVYRQDDLKSAVKKNFANVIPTNYSINDQQFDAKITSVDTDKSGATIAVLQTSVQLLPTLTLDQIRKSLVGKSLPETETYLRGIPGIVGFEVVYTKTVPFASKSSLPHLLSNLTVKVQPRN